MKSASIASRQAIVAVGLLASACGSDEGVPGTYEVSGVVRYEDKPPLPSGALGPIAPKPARGISVAIIGEDDGLTLGMGVTDDSGAYSLSFEGVSGEKIHVLAIASSASPARPIEVRRTDTTVHGFGGSTITAAVDTTNDVLVTVESGAAQAFNIFDTLVDVMDRIPMAFGTTPVPLTAVWEVGNEDGTYFLGDAMFLLGASDDDDGFDDTVIIHESGHYVEDKLGRSDSPGGDHDGSPTNPTLAWSEGFSTYFAMAVRDDSIYMDSNAGGGWAYNGDTSITKANAAGQISQPVSEDMVTEILWDMGDAPAPDDDPLTTANSHDMVLAVQRYFKTAVLRSGVSVFGVDLVDALDGWFNMNGVTSCTAMRTIVTTTHTFPYDFKAASNPCP